MKILITEDDLLTRRVIEKTLENADMETVSSANGDEALEVLSNQSFDVILIDIHMPGFNGIELIKHIRIKLNNNTPIAIVTRETTEIMVREAFEAGADDYIMKPFDQQYLIERIKKLATKNA